MVTDYLPIRLNLPDDARVLRIAELAKLDDDAAVGKLIRVWAWAQQQTEDGNIPGNERVVDRIAGHKGFAAAMESVGWMSFKNGTISVHEWEKWNSKAAKKRALERDRKRNDRGQYADKSRTKSGQKATNPGPTVTGTETGTEKDSDLNLPVAALSRKCVGDSRAKDLGAELAADAGYDGDDGLIFVRAAAAVGFGLSEDDVRRAAEACRLCKPADVPAYFRTVLSGYCRKRNQNLKTILAAAEVPQ